LTFFFIYLKKEQFRVNGIRTILIINHKGNYL